MFQIVDFDKSKFWLMSVFLFFYFSDSLKVS
uniref:Uncharacterized protein n=1 Tax=Anguilla anguilla TaxID=7936 RepID=A0A0E9TRA0_ANGAN